MEVYNGMSGKALAQWRKQNIEKELARIDREYLKVIMTVEEIEAAKRYLHKELDEHFNAKCV